MYLLRIILNNNLQKFYQLRSIKLRFKTENEICWFMGIKKPEHAGLNFIENRNYYFLESSAA